MGGQWLIWGELNYEMNPPVTFRNADRAVDSMVKGTRACESRNGSVETKNASTRGKPVSRRLFHSKRAREDSNPRPLEPESNALSS